MYQHEFALVLQQHLVVGLDGHLEHVVEELVAHEARRGDQHALHDVEIDVAQDGLHYVVVEFSQTLKNRLIWTNLNRFKSSESRIL